MGFATTGFPTPGFAATGFAATGFGGTGFAATAFVAVGLVGACFVACTLLTARAFLAGAALLPDAELVGLLGAVFLAVTACAAFAVGFAITRCGAAWRKAAASRPDRAVPAVAFIPDTSNPSSHSPVATRGAIRRTVNTASIACPACAPAPKDRLLGMAAAPALYAAASAYYG